MSGSESDQNIGNIPRVGFTAAGLMCALIQSLSLQSFPCSHGSLLNTMPLSGVANGEGCDHRQCGFVHFSENLQRVGDGGRSGTGKFGRVGCGVAGVGATVGVEDGAGASTD